MHLGPKTWQKSNFFKAVCRTIWLCLFGPPLLREWLEPGVKFCNDVDAWLLWLFNFNPCIVYLRFSFKIIPCQMNNSTSWSTKGSTIHSSHRRLMGDMNSATHVSLKYLTPVLKTHSDSVTFYTAKRCTPINVALSLAFFWKYESFSDQFSSKE